MKTILIFLLPVFISVFNLSAQNNESYKIFKMESIYLKGNKYIKNDVQYPVGFFGNKLKEEMQISPYAIAEWDSFVKYRNWSFITSITGLGLVLAASSVEQENTQVAMLVGGLGLSIVSIPLSIKSNNQLQKSIWTRNRDLLLN